MPLTQEIPFEAMPVIEVLRRSVSKPKLLRKGEYGGSTPLYFLCHHTWGSNKYHIRDCCPMGLHPKSLVPFPFWARAFAGGVCTEKAVTAFSLWWDNLEQNNIQLAVDEIWPDKKGD